MTSLLAKLGLGAPSTSRRRNNRDGGVESLPLYSPIAASDFSSSSSPLRLSESDCTDRAATNTTTTTTTQRARTRFLADFTLGFADGLTVPFALTAGLSSLGRTETVIYAGMAEICAGSISMGVGGYLAARGEERDAADAAAAAARGGDDGWGGNGSEKEGQAAVTRYLGPLDLPPQLVEMVLEHVRQRPGIGEALLLGAERDNGGDEDGEGEQRGGRRLVTSPVFVGLSVSLGYLLGGLLPLFPYFFVSHVGDGLLWSFAVCVVALFVFGFSKDFALSRRRRRDSSSSNDKHAAMVVLDGRGRVARRVVPWGDIGRSAWEGAQMVILGSVAALAAVLCVRMFEGLDMTSSEASA